MDTLYHVHRFIAENVILDFEIFPILEGKVPENKREKILRGFRETEKPAVLISQIRTGGIGVNIQAASVVFIAEPQWKPSTESQAIARCHRMGQTRNVLVYRILSPHTIDLWVYCRNEEKRNIFNLYVRDAEIVRYFEEALDTRRVSEETLKEFIYEVELRRWTDLGAHDTFSLLS